MSLSFNAAVSARASFDDGNWCGTKPGPHPHIGGGGVPGDGDWCGTKPGPHPHPHFDGLSALATLLEKVGLNPQPLPPGGDGGHGSTHFDPENPCGNGIVKGPFPPRPHLSDALGAVSHQVMNALRGM